MGKSGYNLVKWLYSGKKWLYSEKGVVFEQKLLCSGKLVVFGQGGFIREIVVVLEQKWLYSG